MSIFHILSWNPEGGAGGCEAHRGVLDGVAGSQCRESTEVSARFPELSGRVYGESYVGPKDLQRCDRVPPRTPPFFG